MALNKTDKSFKTLINKRFTTPDRNFYQEIGKDTLNTHMREVWMNTIPEDSASAIIQGYAAYYEQWILTSDPTYDDQAFYFISGSGFTPGTDSINSGWLVNEASQSFFIGDFISDKYGFSYEVKLYDASGSQLFKTDAINWIFDYKTGVLHVADPGAYPIPYKVTVFKYTGLTLADPGAIPSGSISGSVSNWTGSVDGSISRYSNVKITGSLGVTDTITSQTASFGNVTGYGVVLIGQSSGKVMHVYSDKDETIGYFEQTDGNKFITPIVAAPVLRVYRNNRDNSDILYTNPAFMIRNHDPETTSSCFNIKIKPYVGSSTTWEVFNVDYWGNTFVSGNLSLSTGSTVDGVDIDIFSSSVATQIANLETGSGQWTIELDGSISRNSDVRITGSLYISGSDNRLYGTASWADTSSQAVSSSYAVTSSYAESVAPGIGGLWTGSDGYIERIGDVRITGSLGVSVTSSLNNIDFLPDFEIFTKPGFSDDILYIQAKGGITGDGDGMIITAPAIKLEVQEDPVRTNLYYLGLGSISSRDVRLRSYGHTEFTNPNTWHTMSGHLDVGKTGSFGYLETDTDIKIYGTLFTEYSSSVATNLTALNTITGSYWTGSAGGAISRSSDVQITGDVDINGGLNIDQVQDGNAITIDPDRYINFNSGLAYGWSMAQVNSPSDTFIAKYTKIGNNIGYFVFYSGAGDKTNAIIFSGSLVVNKNSESYNPSNVFEVYGDSFMSGSIEVSPNATVDGVDISEFSSSVATNLTTLNAITSSYWTGSSDGNISRNVNIGGNVYAVTIDNQGIGRGLSISTERNRALNVATELGGTRLYQIGAQLGETGSEAASLIWRSNDPATSLDYYSEPVLRIINHDPINKSIPFQIQVGNPEIDSLIYDYDGNLSISGSFFLSQSIYLVDGKTVDGVDISEFSSSVAQQIVNIETGSSIWSLEGDNSISRNSDVKITGSLFSTGTNKKLALVSADTKGGNYSVAIGRYASASADYSVVIGGASSLGLSSIVDSDYGTIIGGGHSKITAATLQYGTMIGCIDSTLEGYRSIMLGTVGGLGGGLYSFTAGHSNTTYGLYSVTFGYNNITIGEYQFVTGKYNVAKSSSLFIVGDGANVGNRKNVFEIIPTGLRLTGSIYVTAGDTVDGVDISEFSSSVAQQIVNIETGSSIWSLEGDNSISRNSDVKITGSLYFTGSKWEDRIVLPDSQYIKLGDDWKFSSIDSNNEFYIEFNKAGTNIGTFGLQPGTQDKISLKIYSGSVEINTQGVATALTNGIVLTAYGQSLLYGDVDVRSNILMQGGKTVDGVDISEFSSSVAQQIYNLETGSTPWTTEVDNSISRYSDVRITGSLDINGNITGDITRTNLSYKSTMSADYSAIIGGAFNEMVGASNNYNIILGGRYNNFVNNNTDFAGILAGELNTMAADWSVILGGYDNTMNGELSAILGGQENKIDWDAIQGVILGGVGLINSGSSQVVLGQWNKKGNTSDIFVIGNGTTDLNRSDSFTITSGGDLTLSGSITLSPSETVDGVDISSFSSSVEQRITNAETGSALWSLEQDGSISRNSNVRMTGSVYINSSTYPALTIRELATAYYLQFYVDTPNIAGILFNDSAGDPAIQNDSTAFTIYGGGGGKLIRIYGDTSDVKIGNLLSNKIMITGSVNITGSTAISGNLDVSESGSFSYLSVNDSVIVELITANTGSFDLLDVVVSASFQDYVEVDGFMHIDGGTW